nr:MAG TPA: hypothetical protein [Caudoviricetes sp.]DAZ36538.1 MAG TPA: hypothetical protein [Caudoviricetes sp.]
MVISSNLLFINIQNIKFLFNQTFVKIGRFKPTFNE